MSESTRIFLGKNKVMIKALGRSPEDEVEDNSHILSKYLTGQVCLAFSNLSIKELEQKFGSFEVEDFAQSGQKATYDVVLEKGNKALEGFGHAMEPQLRVLGLPTRLYNGKIELLSEVYVCRSGATLSVEQAKLLKLLGHKMSSFSLKVLVSRTKRGKIS